MNERMGYEQVAAQSAPAANAQFWDGYSAEYLADHGHYLGAADLLWCPEGLREDAAHLLGEVRGKTVLEVGCGAGQGTRWVARHGGRCLGVDISAGMLRAGRDLDAATGVSAPTVRADARRLPLRDDQFDLAFSAFGALPFISDIAAVHAEVARVLRPAGRWVFSVSHPLRWAFPDVPGRAGLTAVRSYFNETAYAEHDAAGRLAYAEFHHTISGHVRALLAAGFRLTDLVEPQWQEGVTHQWGGWSPLRGAVLPGTLILAGELDKEPATPPDRAR